MKIQATMQDAYNLLHEGTLIMAEMEANGIRVDTDYLRRIQGKITRRIDYLTERIKRDKIYKQWKKIFGGKTNLGSRSQLSIILFKVMKYPCYKQIATRASADAETLESLNIPFVRRYLRIEKLKKAKGTYLKNIERETINGIVHPNFNLNTVRTYRGSSDHPNFTNIPMRDPFIKKLIRRCFIARQGHCLVDLDFKGSEVNAASWYHKDPVMLEYIRTDPGKLHFDVGKECYILPSKLMTSDIRFAAKNNFTFAQFYGDWWLNCARNLWTVIDRMNLKTAEGMPLKKWLAKKGITKLGSGNPDNIIENSFEEHIRNVEDEFWNNKFKVYNRWREQWWQQYREEGLLQMLTGFIVTGYLNRKEVINYPVQGTAFHALLWSLVKINQLLKKYKMKSLLIGQIHDDAVADVPEKELNDYIEIALDVITIQLKKYWPFIIIPIRVEVEVTPIDGSWYEKKEYKI